MGKGTINTKCEFSSPCPKSLLASYPVLQPTFSSFTFKNFKSGVNFNLQHDEHVKGAFCNEVKPSHVRNIQLLDLPLKVPKCCFDAYNANVARQKQKKLERFGMFPPVKLPDCGHEVEEKVERICDEEERRELPPERITYFPECYLLQDSGSEDEPEEEYMTCSSGSESECSACSTLGGGTRRKMHKVVRKDWREFLHHPVDPCKKIVEDEIRKHKSKQFFEVKIKKMMKQ